MITSLSRITIYVENQEEAKTFWVQKMGFKVMLEQAMGESSWLEVGLPQGGTRLVLYDKGLMKKQNPKVNTGHPSLIFSTLHIETTQKSLKEKGVEIKDVMKLPYGSMCTFHDQDGNVYMLREDKK